MQSLNQVVAKFRVVGSLFTRYRIIIFLLVIGAVYSFVIYRINALASVEPSSDSVNAIVHNKPHIDQATINKIKQLQDNSVNVQTLFDQARQNPFQE
ncbi:MAG: hypothetical protein WC498_00045 [Candidatus Saccharimonadales bacterium]